MKKLKLLIVAAGLFICLAPMPVEAQGIWGACGDAAQSSAICADNGEEAEDIVKRIINLFLYAIGILSVVMIVHSGLKYVTSRGDPTAVKSAKDTLLYSVVGLIVAILAFAIVNFVLGAFSGDGQNQNSGNSQQPPVQGPEAPSAR